MTPRFYNFTAHEWKDLSTEGDVKFHFMPERGALFFEDLGWIKSEFYSFASESIRLNRIPNKVDLKKDPHYLERVSDSGILLLKKQIFS